MSALKSASNGDVINLTSGKYSLDVSGISKDVTITSDGSAVFDHVDLSNVSGLTFDGVDFNSVDGDMRPFRVWGSSDVTFRNGDMEGVASGLGTGRGILIQKSDGVSFSNMSIHGFRTAVWLDGVDDFTFKNNTLTNNSNNGLQGGNIHGAVFSGNSVTMVVPDGALHTDAFQFWNVGTNKPSSDMLFENNTIIANNFQTHGIYMNNDVANKGGGASSYFENVVIRDNVIMTGDSLGLSWGHTNHLDIHGNIVIQNSGLSGKEYPFIRVNAGSTDVSVTGNVALKAVTAANGTWGAVNMPGSWDVSDNKIVKVGTSLADAKAALAAIGGNPTPDPDPGPKEGTSFSFDAAGADDKATVNFSNGDTVLLHDYATGTFSGTGASSDGTSATITSLADLRALDQASSAVTVREGTMDKLVIDIDQAAGDHAIKLLGIAHDYF